jgi:hypothetical protein
MISREWESTSEKDAKRIVSRANAFTNSVFDSKWDLGLNFRLFHSNLPVQNADKASKTNGIVRLELEIRKA